jgi:hypothetical protein
MKTQMTGMNLTGNVRGAILSFVIVLMSVLQALAATSPVELAAAQAPVNLGSAENFGVLAGTTITGVGATVVYGDLGISPGTALVGFPPGVVNGATHVNDAVAIQAQTDLASAYADAAGRSDLVIPVPAELGGLILTQGLYRAASTLAITTADLTLDGLDSTNAVWIFQMGSTLDVAASRTVNLINGARAENVFWQVGSSATIGANVTFRGTILANQSITLGAGGTFEGRALALHAAVTLDANTFLVADTVILKTAAVVEGPYIAEPEANVNLGTQTIIVPLTDPQCFYILEASTKLTFTGIWILEDSVVITYDY